VRHEDFETRRALYASSGVLLDSEHGRVRVVEPFDRPVVALGAVSACAVRIDLTLCLRAVRNELGPAPCAWCKRSRGWLYCREHEFAEALERAARCVTDQGRAWDWAYALGYRHSDARYASGHWTGEPAAYVRGCSDDAGDYARAVWELL
jgi:hypothetical protein